MLSSRAIPPRPQQPLLKGVVIKVGETEQIEPALVGQWPKSGNDKLLEGGLTASHGGCIEPSGECMSGEAATEGPVLVWGDPTEPNYERGGGYEAKGGPMTSGLTMKNKMDADWRSPSGGTKSAG